MVKILTMAKILMMTKVMTKKLKVATLMILVTMTKKATPTPDPGVVIYTCSRNEVTKYTVWLDEVHSMVVSQS